MSYKLLVILSALLIALGCNSQQDNTIGTPPIVNDSSDPTATNTDQPTPSGETNAVSQDAQEQTAESLKSIAKAFFEYDRHFGHFPPAASTDASGNPLLSWRVHILPFVDAYDLYEQFRLDEPWNSDHNLKLVDQMPAIYQMSDADDEGKTSLMVFTGNHAVFGGAKAESRKGPLKPFQKPAASKSRQHDLQNAVFDTDTDTPNVRPPLRGPTIRDITDGTSNTILAVYAGSDKSTPWTKPQDLPFKPEDPVAVLGKIPDDGFVALFWDTRVERLPKDIDRAQLSSFIDSTEIARKGVLQEGQDPPSDSDFIN
jgi:hypothetical protein